MTVLVTGASGFIGRHVVAELLSRSIKVRVACRQGAADNYLSGNVEVIHLLGLGTTAADWADAVADCVAVIHLAARAHVSKDRDKDPARAFRLANVDFTRACAAAALSAGVQRFIFMSSIGVHGSTSGAYQIQAASAIQPHTLSACSKAEAEQALAEVVHGSDMELTVIRPPLVYGLRAPGNFGVLVRAIACGLPLPLGLLTANRRSLIGVDNLVDLIVTCLNHPNAANQADLAPEKRTA